MKFLVQTGHQRRGFAINRIISASVDRLWRMLYFFRRHRRRLWNVLECSTGAKRVRNALSWLTYVAAALRPFSYFNSIKQLLLSFFFQKYIIIHKYSLFIRLLTYHRGIYHTLHDKLPIEGQFFSTISTARSFQTFFFFTRAWYEKLGQIHLCLFNYDILVFTMIIEAEKTTSFSPVKASHFQTLPFHSKQPVKSIFKNIIIQDYDI